MSQKYKNILIFSSPKENSFTAKLLKQCVGDFKDFDYIYNCFENPPAPCNDCGYCKNNFGCNITDLEEFFNIFEKAENATFAFPIYNGSFPAPLKALIDRFQFLFNRRFVQNIKPPISGSRKVTLVMTQGSEDDFTDIILKQIKPVFTISGCSLKKTVCLTGSDKISSGENLTPVITVY